MTCKLASLLLLALAMCGCAKRPATVSPALTDPQYACAPDGDYTWCYKDLKDKR